MTPTVTATATPTATATATATATVTAPRPRRPPPTATPTPTVTATPIDNLPLRTDFTTGIFHATTDQTLTDGEFGGSVTTLPLSGDSSVEFYSPPLTTTGPALTTSDRGGARLWLAIPAARRDGHLRGDLCRLRRRHRYGDADRHDGPVDRRRRPRERPGRVRGAGDESPGGLHRPGGPSPEADPHDPLRLGTTVELAYNAANGTPATPSGAWPRTASSAGPSATSPSAATAPSIPARTVISPAPTVARARAARRPAPS